MIRFEAKGDYNKTFKFLNKLSKFTTGIDLLDKYGRAGVEALREATPKDSGKTSELWSYNIVHFDTGFKIEFLNSNVHEWANIAILLQYGHGTPTGGYVAGRDYINPAIQPIFDELAEKAWKEITGK